MMEEPITVHVENLPQEKPVSDASYITIPLAAAGSPVLLASQDTKRYRVLVWADAKVMVGRRDEVSSGKGVTLDPAHMTAPLELWNQNDVWAANAGVAVNISVVIERMGG